MKKKYLFFHFIFLFLFFENYSFAQQNLKFADIDLIIKNTNIGKETLNKLNDLDQININKLSKFEKELNKIENDINLKKNLWSNDEYNKEIQSFNLKLKDYNNQKKEMVNKLSEIKNKELKKIFEIITPIIENYMRENSIDILFSNKNIFIGNKNSDLTNELIKLINSKANR
tara:strand:- start:122 stop:637 length:516 start_codon:yes stop_codon:yes gene_type:complete